MNILYLLSEFPYPPTDGVRAKLFNVLTYVSAHHECDIISFGSDMTGSTLQQFRAACPTNGILGIFGRQKGVTLTISQVMHVLRLQPGYLARWRNGAFAAAVTRAIELGNYDLVHIDGIALAPYMVLCNSLPVVFSINDAISRRQMNAASHIKNPAYKLYRLLSAQLTKNIERQYLPQATTVHVASDVEQDYLRNRYSNLNVQVIPIATPDDLLVYHQLTTDDNNPLTIVFSGSLADPGIANGLLQFLTHVYPQLLGKYPNLCLRILGRGCPEAIRRIVETHANVEFVPWVDDYYGALSRADVVVFPDLSGTGIKTRVLYAMGLGKAIVATPVALEGIHFTEGVHCMERSTNDGFVEALVLLLGDKPRRIKMGEAAQDLVHSHYTMKTLGPKWVELYKDSIARFAIKHEYQTTEL